MYLTTNACTRDALQNRFRVTHAKHTNSVTSSKCKAALNGCTYEKPYLNAQFILKMWLFCMQAIIGLNVYLPAITTVSLDLSIIDSAFFFLFKKIYKEVLWTIVVDLPRIMIFLGRVLWQDNWCWWCTCCGRGRQL